MNTVVNTKRAAQSFKAIFETLGRDDVTDLLMNWNDSELSDDGSRIRGYAGRDREYSHGRDGGKVNISKREFILWLLSEAPFDESIYGKGIRENTEWSAKILAARLASGITPTNKEWEKI